MGKENAGDSVTIDLKYPVTFGDETVNQVTVRRPRGKDLKGLHNLKESHDDQMKLIARLIGHPVSFVDEMDLATDLQKVMEATMDFLPDGQ